MAANRTFFAESEYFAVLTLGDGSSINSNCS